MKRRAPDERVERWFRLLLRLYPPDFRDDMGELDGRDVPRPSARGAEPRRHHSARRRVGARAGRLGAQRSGRAGAARGSVAARRQLGPRYPSWSARRLMRSPAFAAAMVGTLTVGLGTFAVVYTVVQKILIEPMPYRNPDDLVLRLARLHGPSSTSNAAGSAGRTSRNCRRPAASSRTPWALLRTRQTFSAREGTDPTEITVMVTSPNLFELLGVRPALGRALRRERSGPRPPGADRADARAVEPARRRSSIVGTDVRLNGQPHTVIGVMPPTFAFVQERQSRAAAARRRLYHVQRQSRGDESGRRILRGSDPRASRHIAAGRGGRRGRRRHEPSTRVTSRAAA